MKPVMQTIMTKGMGNCFPACIASILELNLDDVPNFYHEYGASGFEEACSWMQKKYNLSIAYIRKFEKDATIFSLGSAYLIGSGLSPRGLCHSVVFQCLTKDNGDNKEGFRMVHDPHPDGGGIESVDSLMIFTPCWQKEPKAVKKCPDCEGKLSPVFRRDGSMLNSEQFNSIRAGDYYCTKCPGNFSRTGYRYFWERDLK